MTYGLGLFAGTPLGDPIELGAVAAVFLSPKTSSRSQHAANITLLAAKSWVGHAEPAAGILGLAHAHLALHHHMQLPFLHLAQLNPHVASALQQGSTLGQFLIRRQQAAMLGLAGNPDGRLRCGVSAFAFQGTNAHAIIEQAESHSVVSQSTAQDQLQWQKSRHWIAPPAHALLTKALLLPGSGTITMVADLSSARASQLVHGVLMQGTAMLSLDLYTELMAEALQQVATDASPMQLQQLTSVSASMPSHGGMTHPQQLTLKLTGTKLSIEQGVSETGSDNVCCQAVVVCASESAPSRAEPVPRASPILRALLIQSHASRKAAATAVVSNAWTQDQGFCLPGAVISAASQLQTSFTPAAVSAAVPTAVACLGLQQASSAASLALTVMQKSAGKLDTAVSSVSCSGPANVLLGIQLTSAHRVVSSYDIPTGHVTLDRGMLYETQWTVSNPEHHTGAQTAAAHWQFPGRHVTDPVAACASLMAHAQQAVTCSNGQKLNLQLTMGQSPGPYQAMALALLRSAAQESSSLACSALGASPHSTRSVNHVAATASVCSPPALVSKSDGGLVYEPKLAPSAQQQSPSMPSQAAATCIILGGTGSIGSLAALWMADSGAEEVIMVGRTGKLSSASASNFSTLLANQASGSGNTMITIARLVTSAR